MYEHNYNLLPPFCVACVYITSWLTTLYCIPTFTPEGTSRKKGWEFCKRQRAGKSAVSRLQTNEDHCVQPDHAPLQVEMHELL